jgi:hypothetical protein
MSRREKTVFFLSCFAEPLSKGCFSLAVKPSRQENGIFAWLFGRAAKKTMCFLGCFG